MTDRRLFLSPPHMGGEEIEFVRAAFASNYIAPTGPMVDGFEREFLEYIGMPYGVAVTSGTAALHLALRHLGVGPGDRVVAPTLTFIGSVTPILFQGAVPEFLDCGRRDWNMDPDILAEHMAESASQGRLPKAVVTTDLYGQPSDVARMRTICQAYSVPLVCDSAEAVGTFYAETDGQRRHAGWGAECAVFSFNGNKIITTSGGGFLACHDKAMADHARKLAAQAREPVPWYEHAEVGYNYRMSNIIAAIGRGQLRVLEERVRGRRHIYDMYRERLAHQAGLTFAPAGCGARWNHWLTVLLIDADEFGASPGDVRLALEKVNAEARPIWKPMHLQPVFQNCLVRNAGAAETFFKRGLCLPSGTAMSESDVDRVCSTVLNARRRRALA